MTAWGEVTVRRSATGMPLLEAETEPAAFFGLGYAQAADEPDALLRKYLLVRGELATVDGPGATGRDENQRRWQVLEEARTAFASLPAALQDCYRAFIAGVSAYFDEHPRLLPAWAPPLEPALPIGVNRTVMLYWTIADAAQELRAAGIPLPEVVSELDRTPMTPGSNAWVVAPWRTRDGEAFLVSDPHLPFGGAYAMHEATVVTPTLHYTGFTFLGAMLPPLAHTADIAWGVTTGGPRVSDAYRVPDTAEPAVELNGVRSPIVARHDGAAYAICSPYTDRAAATELQLLAMLRARDAGELRETFAAGGFPPQNVLAADRTGASFYLRTGRVPRRPDGATGVLDPQQRWNGFLEQDELVHLDGAPSGYLQNANSAPDTVAPELSAEGWSADAFNDVPGRQTPRSERAIQLLARAVDVDADDMLAWAVDDLWPDTPAWQDGLAAAVDAHPARIAALPAERRAFLRLLLDFDGHASPTSVGASAWLAWRGDIARTPEAPETLRDRVDALDPELLLGALEHCALETRPYGELHTIAGHPGRGGSFTVRPGAAGDVQPTMQAALRATYFADGEAFAGGPALRVVRFGSDGMRSWSLLLPRQAAAFSRGEVLPTAFHPRDADDVDAVRRLTATDKV
ncbi:penicillin acylase family protein [Leifsonia naganoensis]|uniref:Penicillin amidase n=1 Tax=Leifsonia naganoensis TaxID=150025 RepID=A0A853DLH5_9MICO|nr:penicillin acylase family protein [Leifsonia naganoensis]NYK09288.1 hypothetical protein [Leifsonia naganoensis]